MSDTTDIARALLKALDIREADYLPRTVQGWLDEIAAALSDAREAGRQEAEKASFPFDREFLGRLVRLVWVAWAREQPAPPPHHLLPWEHLTEAAREVDRRIGEKVAQVACATVERALEQAEAEVARLRAVIAQVEWVSCEDRGYGGATQCCVWCGAGRYEYGHKADCPRQQALREGQI